MDYLSLVVVLAVVVVVVFAVLGFQGMLGGVADAFGGIGKGLTDAVKSTQDAFGDTGKAIQDAFGDTGQAITDAFGDTGKALQDALGDTGQAFQDVLQIPSGNGARIFDEATREIQYPIQVVIPSRPERVVRGKPALTVREYFREKGISPRMRLR